MPTQYKRYGFLDQHPEAILGPFAAAFGFLAYLNLATLATGRPTVGGGWLASALLGGRVRDRGPGRARAPAPRGQALPSPCSPVPPGGGRAHHQQEGGLGRPESAGGGHHRVPERDLRVWQQAWCLSRSRLMGRIAIIRFAILGRG